MVCLFLPCTGTCCCDGFYVDAGNPNSGLRAYTTGTVPTSVSQSQAGIASTWAPLG